MFERAVRSALKPDQLSEFCRHVGAMCSAGVPLAAAMEILQMGTENKKMSGLYGELQRMMEQGSSFSDALAKTKVFPEFLLNMFRAAESSGHMEETAKQMAVYYRKEHKIKSQIQSGTLYPKILSIVSIFVILTVFIVVLPTVEPLFRKMELPLLTKGLLFFSRMIIEWWYLWIGILAILYMVIRVLLKKKKVKNFCDRMKLYIPVVGKQCRILYTARFARSESSLYSSGFPMVEGLLIAARTIGNQYLEDQFQNVVRMIEGGTSFSQAIESVDGFDKKLAPVIFVGEESGKLDEMLESIADGYEYDAEAAINRIVAMVEPLMIVIMGIIIGIILLGIMIPMWSMYEYIA